jgi:hypothetical protein
MTEQELILRAMSEARPLDLSVLRAGRGRARPPSCTDA